MSSKSSSLAVIGLNGTTCVSSAEKYSFPSFAVDVTMGAMNCWRKPMRSSEGQ